MDARALLVRAWGEEVQTMAYSMRCADMGGNCPGSFTTETEGELVRHIELHAEVQHPDLPMDQETKAKISQLVKQV